MKKLTGLLLIIMVSLSTYSQDSKIIEGMHSLSSQTLNEIVIELSSEKYGGRLTGAPGYDLSAEYLIEYFKKNGIKAGGEHCTYLQKFPHPYTHIYKDCSLSLILENGVSKHYEYVTEYIPGATSASGTVEAEVVYAGYGITAPELGYDDFKDIDVKGKIVMIEREIPMRASDDPEKFKKWAKYSFHQYKLKNVIEHGAIGMIYNYGPISNPNNDYYEGFVYSHIGDSVAKDIFAGQKYSHAQTIEKIKKKLKPQSFYTGKTVRIKNTTKHYPDAIGSNVIGLIEGSDPVLKNEVIVISAHLDHLGYCYDMMPGANDNASGVAVIMEVAKALKKYDIKLKRSLLFVAFGAEEAGIVGSKIYLERPIFPLDKTVGMINLDGVGVGTMFYATAGKNFPELFKPLADANEKYVHREVNPSHFLNISRPRLDAARFMTAGIPIVSFGAYGIPTNGQSVYHTPMDDIDRITPEIMEDLARIIYLGVIEIANR